MPFALVPQLLAAHVLRRLISQKHQLIDSLGSFDVDKVECREEFDRDFVMTVPWRLVAICGRAWFQKRCDQATTVYYIMYIILSGLYVLNISLDVLRPGGVGKSWDHSETDFPAQPRPLMHGTEARRPSTSMSKDPSILKKHETL